MIVTGDGQTHGDTKGRESRLSLLLALVRRASCPASAAEFDGLID